MKKVSCIFLCGDRSPYGLAHLEPIARHFDLRAIVIADTARWRTFRETLSGGEPHEYSSGGLGIRSAAKCVVRAPRTLYRWHRHRTALRAPGAPILKINDANRPEAKARIQAVSAEVLLSAAYPQILDDEVLSLSPRKAVNFHPSLLPRCRGAHPHYWCLATGEETGGVTAHYMTEQIDRGDILAQRPIDLTGLYYADLYGRITEETPALVEDVARFLADPDANAVPQDESRATTFRNDREVHRLLRFDQQTAVELWNRVRAGRAHTSFSGFRIDIERAHVAEGESGWPDAPGTVSGLTDDAAAVAAADSRSNRRFLAIETVRSGRQVEPFTRWMESRNLQIGDVLG